MSASIAGRYLVHEELGRGGLAVVYRVTDTVTGRKLALKQLTMAQTNRLFREQAAAFEREFHTLVQLSHPRIIEVYDFGTDDDGRYYTMELLDGGDLKERSPLPWREACALCHDVCSSLALLHSRRLLHRDVSPRNVRSTQDGSAKLIDFGALVPMGTGGQIVGTPQCVAPEVLHRSTLDARTDLFSLGATLYFTLTSRFAYPAREFSRLHEVWRMRPVPPSLLTAGIPPALDALVMSLLALDPALRPRSAYEVMQRLAAIAGIERIEPAGVSQAYLSTPVVVGRDLPLAALRARVDLALAGQGSSVLIQGAAGIGRSRMLDACALQAKIAGAAVLRVNASIEDDEPLAAGQSLAAQVVETLPELAAGIARREHVTTLLFDEPEPSSAHAAAEIARPALKRLAGRGGDRPATQSALTRWLLEVARAQPLAILIDDVHRVDEASLSLLAALVLAAPRRRLILVATAETGAEVQAVDAFAVLKRDCAAMALEPLTRDQTEALLNSVFGDVPNLALVSDRLHQAALGNPRETMELVQFLIAKGAVSYEGGQWLLPGQLDPAELPSSAVETCRHRVAELSELARRLAQVHALASHPTLSRDDYALAASDVPSARLDEALTELLSQRVLAGDGHAYVLSRREWSDALISGLDAEALRDRHRMLAALYARHETLTLERSHHLLASGHEPAGLDLLTGLLLRAVADSQGLLSLTKMSADRVAAVLDRALTSAERLRRKPREIHELRRALIAIAIVTDENHYFRVARAWFEQLRQDSGLAFYEAITDAPDPGQRLMRALTQASERYAATPEHERVCDPEQAIKGLAYHVAVSIAIGSRAQEGALVASLPAVLEPFAPLSPLLHAIWQNAIATRESMCDNQPVRARTRWLEVDAALSKVSASELSWVAALRGAIAYGIGLLEARLGLLVEQRARALDQDPLQSVSAMSLRKIARLHQGDVAGAERFRKQAEQLSLQANLRQMFTSTLPAELIAYALASDLTGIRQVADAIAPLAARFPGWVVYEHLADGCFEQTRGQLEAALQAFERGLAISDPVQLAEGRSSNVWPRLEAGRIEVLVGLGRAEQAKAHGERALAACAEHGIDIAAFVIRRALALAEAKLGDYAAASRRLEEVIGELRALGVTGLELGATYEARARIAVWFSDDAAITAYGQLAAKEYRHGEGSPLGARYERLMDEARSAGVVVLPQLTDLQTQLSTSHLRSAPVVTLVQDKLAGADTTRQRAERVLQLLCEARAARSGHLYLHTERGLELVASLGPAAPDAMLDEYVSSYVTQQLDATDCATVVESDNVPVLTAAHWVDRKGAAHQPMLLVGEIDGARLCAGAAVIEAGERTMSSFSTQELVEAISEYLLRAGDARSVGKTV